MLKSPYRHAFLALTLIRLASRILFNLQSQFQCHMISSFLQDDHTYSSTRALAHNWCACVPGYVRRATYILIHTQRVAMPNLDEFTSRISWA